MTTTEAEEVMRTVFAKLSDTHFEFYFNFVVCFTCGDYFPYNGKEVPHRCPKMDPLTKGSFALPDILIRYDPPIWRESIDKDMKDYFDVHRYRYGVVRIDGGIHNKNRLHKMHDWHQLEAFRNAGMKVFIIKK